MSMILPPPVYDRRRLEQLVAEHKWRVHMARRKGGKPTPETSGVKAPR